MARGLNGVMSKVMMVHLLLLPLLLLSATASAEEGWRPIIVRSPEVRPPPSLKSERFVRDLEMRER